MITFDVAGRYLFNKPLPGVVDYTEVLMIGTVFCGMAYAQSINAHVKITLVSSRMPQRFATALLGTCMIFVCAVVAWILFSVAERALESLAVQESRFGLVAVPIWPARIILAVGILALLIELILSTVNVLRSFFTGEVPKELSIDSSENL